MALDYFMKDLLNERLSDSSSTLIFVDNPTIDFDDEDDDQGYLPDEDSASSDDLTLKINNGSSLLPQRKVRRARSLDTGFEQASALLSSEERRTTRPGGGSTGFRRKSPLCRWSDMFRDKESSKEYSLSVPKRSQDRFLVTRHQSDSSLLMPSRRRSYSRHRDKARPTEETRNAAGSEKQQKAHPKQRKCIQDSYSMFTSPLLCKRSKKELRLRRTLSERISVTHAIVLASEE
jgi:hypothetical protein